MGKVALEGMEFFAHHGFYAEERLIGNKYEVDVTIDLDFHEAAESDELSGTVNYEVVYEIVKGVMSEEAKLLEHLAAKIILGIREKFSEVKSVEVKVSKFNPPIKGLCKRAAVTLVG